MNIWGDVDKVIERCRAHYQAKEKFGIGPAGLRKVTARQLGKLIVDATAAGWLVTVDPGRNAVFVPPRR
jgi:hypothetical protein